MLLLFARSAGAHPARLAAGIAKIDRAGNVKITLTIDLPAFVLDDTPQRISDADMKALVESSPSDLQAQLDDAQDRLLHSTKLRDGTLESATVPTVQQVEQLKQASGSMPFPMMMDVSVSGKIDPGATGFSIQFPEVLGSIVLTIERPDMEPRALAVEGGSWSIDVPLSAKPQAAGAPQVSEPSRFSVALRYLALGFEHIVPQGPDHILFILGLFLLSTRLSSLLWQISAFTVAHSITLGLALYGIVRLPPSIVEPAIAGSIAFVAIENIWTSKLHAWRPVVVFGFGLIHGMGFASVLLDMGLPRHDFAPALVAFNCGVELGQLAVVVMALLAVGWFRNRDWYRRAIVIPMSACIAVVGTVWMIQRIVA